MVEALSLPDFSAIARALGQSDPAELHGTLCGMLCFDEVLDSDYWLKVILGAEQVADLSALDRQALQGLYRATQSQLHDHRLSFALLLPDDELSLLERTAALGRWCRGFLSGLGLGMQPNSQFPHEVKEFIDDVSKIAQVGFFALDEASDDDEVAFTEIVEYVRVGVMLTHQELRPPLRVPEPQSTHNRLH